MKVSVLLALIFQAALVLGNSVTLTGSQYSVEVNDDLEYRLYPSQDSSTYVRLRLKEITQANATGVDYPNNPRSAQPGSGVTWTTGTDSTGKSADTTQMVDVSNSGNAQITLESNNILFTTTTTTEMGTVQADQFKSTVKLTGWPWGSTTTDTLNFYFEVSSSGCDDTNSTDGADQSQDSDNENIQAISFTDFGLVNFLDYVTIYSSVDDTTGTNTPVTITLDVNDDGGSGYDVVVNVPYFAYAVEYDPLIKDSGNAAGSVAASFTLMFSLMTALLFSNKF